jgi:hypothetical protein
MVEELANKESGKSKSVEELIDDLPLSENEKVKQAVIKAVDYMSK